MPRGPYATLRFASLSLLLFSEFYWILLTVFRVNWDFVEKGKIDSFYWFISWFLRKTIIGTPVPSTPVPCTHYPGTLPPRTRYHPTMLHPYTGRSYPTSPCSPGFFWIEEDGPVRTLPVLLIILVVNPRVNLSKRHCSRADIVNNCQLTSIIVNNSQ